MATQHLDLDEQEQLANIKYFWQKYGLWISTVLTIFALGYLGWTGWQWWQNNQSQKAAVLFDEPLTVIDPHLKWQLRRKLKQIHHELKLTLIYVTHDQVEALTFADQVVVMTRGRAVQVGSAADLFERPSHTFVGHFIGSPGMNFLPGQVEQQGVQLAGMSVMLPAGRTLPFGKFRLGIRPEYLRLVPAHTSGALEMKVSHVQDVGTHVMLSANVEGHTVKARLSSDAAQLLPGDLVWLKVLSEHTCFYINEEIVP